MIQLRCLDGADLAFDKWTLINFLQVGRTRKVHNLIANISAKAKNIVARVASAFQPQVLATARV